MVSFRPLSVSACGTPFPNGLSIACKWGYNSNHVQVTGMILQVHHSFWFLFSPKGYLKWIRSFQPGNSAKVTFLKNGENVTLLKGESWPPTVESKRSFWITWSIFSTNPFLLKTCQEICFIVGCQTLHGFSILNFHGISTDFTPSRLISGWWGLHYLLFSAFSKGVEIRQHQLKDCPKKHVSRISNARPIWRSWSGTLAFCIVFLLCLFEIGSEASIFILMWSRATSSAMRKHPTERLVFGASSWLFWRYIQIHLLEKVMDASPKTSPCFLKRSIGTWVHHTF